MEDNRPKHVTPGVALSVNGFLSHGVLPGQSLSSGLCHNLIFGNKHNTSSVLFTGLIFCEMAVRRKIRVFTYMNGSE